MFDHKITQTLATEKIHITTERALAAIDQMVQKGIYNNLSDALNQLGVGEKNAYRLKTGGSKLTIQQIQALCDKGNISADYILGYTSQMYRKPARTLIELLEEATRAAKSL